MIHRHRITLWALLAAALSLFFISPARAQVMNDPGALSYPPLSYSPPKAERVQLDNGIILYLIEDRELPLVQISVVARMGSIYDPPGLEGLAEITAAVMRTGGAHGASGDAVDEELDFLAADVSISMERESGSAAFSALTADLDRGLAIFSDILIRPEFQEEKLLLAKELKIEELKRISDNPQKLAFREFTKVFFRDDIRGRLATVESVGRISRADLVEYHRRYFVPSNIMMAVAGDFSKEEILKKVENCFGSWHSELTVEKVSPPGGDRPGGLYYLHKDAPQSVLISGQIAPGQQSRDYYAMEVLDFIIGGGGFKSRIFAEVRNNLGLAYSAGSFYSPKSDYGIFGTYAMTKASSSAQVLTVIQSILEEVKTAAVEDSVLKWAKDSLTNRFVFSFTSAAQIARQRMMIEFNELDRDFTERYCRRIGEVTSDDLKRAAVDYLDGTTRVLFVLGDEARFDTPLTAFGPVQKIEPASGLRKEQEREPKDSE